MSTLSRVVRLSVSRFCLNSCIKFVLTDYLGINANYDDTATLRSITASGIDDICVTYEGNSNGEEPTESGSGPDGTNCKYSNSDITQA